MHNTLLQQFVNSTWNGDVSLEEVLVETGIDFKSAELFLAHNERFVQGIPFSGEDAEYDELLKNHCGAVALQEIVDRFD